MKTVSTSHKFLAAPESATSVQGKTAGRADDHTARREHTRKLILKAALDIAIAQGWSALSMRKVADRISYTAPIIYEHFSSKAAMIGQLTQQGFDKLHAQILRAETKAQRADEKVLAMWLAYADFAFSNSTLYKAMFGLQIQQQSNTVTQAAALSNAFLPSIFNLNPNNNTDTALIKSFNSYWCWVHGMISISLVYDQQPSIEDRAVLIDSITSITNSIIQQKKSA